MGLDTNVVLRYLLQDDPAQTLQANRIFGQELSDQNPGFINLPTTLEIVGCGAAFSGRPLPKLRCSLKTFSLRTLSSSRTAAGF